jgi:hypothetical protein
MPRFTVHTVTLTGTSFPLASLGVSLEGRGSSQGDSVDCEPRHCASKDTLSELDFAHVCKCVLGRQQAH